MSSKNVKLSVVEMQRLTPDEFAAADKVPLVVVLDNVRSQHNVGSVFRTADAFRLEGVWLCGICCTPPNQEIHKTALGAELTVDWQYFKNTTDAVDLLHKQGYTVFAIEQAHNSVFLDQLQLSNFPSCGNRYAIVLGHEVFGVAQEVIDCCDACIEIPQYGTKHSMNVSVTAGIVMYEMCKKITKQ